jgi:hypothetical protein
MSASQFFNWHPSGWGHVQRIKYKGLWQSCDVLSRYVFLKQEIAPALLHKFRNDVE